MYTRQRLYIERLEVGTDNMCLTSDSGLLFLGLGLGLGFGFGNLNIFDRQCCRHSWRSRPLDACSVYGFGDVTSERDENSGFGQ